MIVSREYVNNYLESHMADVALKSDKIKEVCDYCFERYNVPRGVVSDYITMRKSLEEASEFILFILLDGLLANKIINRNLDNFFTESEISTYSKAKYKDKQIKMPLKFSAIQVAPDQWIGSITVQEIMELSKAQKIKYNENAQRTMKKIIRGDKEYYKITINKKAVGEIKEAFNNKMYIPNTITFNIPEETEYNFGYDAASKTLIITELENFDIIDGYHRYIALNQLKLENPNFDYMMELRIVNFSEEKARSFIYQEDQKTKMAKVDVNTFNALKPGNRVCDRLNGSSKCNIQGLIGQKGIIPYAELASIIDFLYFKNMKSKEKERLEIIELTKELTEDFNMLTEYDSKYLTENYSFKRILGIMYVFYLYRDKDKTGMCETIEKLVQKLNATENSKFYGRTPRRALINEIKKLLEGDE